MNTKFLTAAVSSAALMFASAAYADGSPVAEYPEPAEPTAPAEAPAEAYAPAAPEYNWYTTIFAGAVFGDGDVTVPPIGEIPLETGYLVGWTLGYDDMFDGGVLGVRPEVEVSYRNQDLDDDGALAPLSLNSGLLAVMGNVWFDFDLGGGFTPYAGGGIGIGFADALIFESEEFMWQFGGGVNFDTGDRTFLGVGYRYLGGDFEETGIEWEYRKHEVLANFGVRF